MNLKTVLGWVALAFVVWWIVTAPTSAAHIVHNVGNFLSTAAHGFSSFVSSI